MWISDGYDPKAPPAKQFRNPVHCADLSVDRLLYVCDRVNDRIQVFKPGWHVRQGGVLQQGDARIRARRGTSRSPADPQQKYLYLADGENDKGACHPARHARAPHQLWRGRTAAGRRSTACTASPPTRRATSTRPRPTAASACRVRLQGPGAGDEEGPGRGVAQAVEGEMRRGGRTVPSPIARRQGDRGAAVGHYASVRGTRHPATYEVDGRQCTS